MTQAQSRPDVISKNLTEIIEFLTQHSPEELDAAVELGNWYATIQADMKRRSLEGWTFLFTLYAPYGYMQTEGPKMGELVTAYAVNLACAPVNQVSDEEAAKQLEDHYLFFPCDTNGEITSVEQESKTH